MDPLAISLLVRWLLGWFLCLRLPRLPQHSLAPDLASELRLSVLIPARNEARTLPRFLAALKRQSLQPLEVLEVDDHSSDATAAIAQAAGATLLTSAPLPPGWTGKNWALHQASQASSGDLLVFLDADTQPGHHVLARICGAQRQLGGLVSVQPFHRTERPYEQLSVLFNLVGLMAVPLGARVGVAFGPAMVTSRADYERIGGHTAVANRVVEDWFLAHAYGCSGLPVSAYIGDGDIEYRMYPGGLRELVLGFDKNFATAAGEVRWPWMLAVLLWLSGLFWAAWCLPASLLHWPMVGDRSLLANLVLYVGFSLQLGLLTRRVGSFGWINVLFPIPVIFFLGVFVLAIFNLERGTIEWKDRQIPTR